MNANISEKVVNVRIQGKNNEEISESIGAYIKKERIASGLNQDYVCKGICSISYFSRIENNQILPTGDYIEKIFKRLNKPVPMQFSVKTNNKEIIVNFLSAIEFKNDGIIRETYNEIKKNLQDYELYELVYCLYKKNWSEAERLIKQLHPQQRYFNNEELLLFLEMLTSYYIDQTAYDKAEKYVLMALKLQQTMNVEKPLLYYKYAWILGKTSNDLKCIDYASKAEEMFKLSNNIYRTIQCQMLIAIKLSNKYFEKSVYIYENIIKSAMFHNYNDLYKNSSLNLGHLYKEYRLFDKSKELYIKLIDFYNNDELFITNVYIELIDLLILDGNNKEAQRYLNDFKLIKNHSNKSIFYIKYLDLKLNDVDLKSKINLYDNVFIPYCLLNNNTILEKRIRKEYSDILEINHMYKESIEQNKKIIELLEKEKNKKNRWR